MNLVEKTLYRTRTNIRQVCKELGIDFEEGLVTYLEECAHCSIWLKPRELKPDLDGNPVCTVCLEFEGA